MENENEIEVFKVEIVNQDANSSDMFKKAAIEGIVGAIFALGITIMSSYLTARMTEKRKAKAVKVKKIIDTTETKETEK